MQQSFVANGYRNWNDALRNALEGCIQTTMGA